MSSTLLLVLHVVLYSIFPLCFGALSKRSRSYAYYLYIALMLLLGGLLGAFYAFAITDSIIISGGNICFAAFWMGILLLLVSENTLGVVRSLLLLVVVVDLSWLGAYAVFGLTLASPDTLNTFNVSAELFAASSLVVVLGGVLILAELLGLVWIGERVKSSFESPLALGCALLGLFFLVLIVDGLVFPLLFLSFDEQLLKAAAGGLAAKVILGVLFAVPLVLHFVIYPDTLRNFQRSPIRLSDLLRQRAAGLSGQDLQEYRLVDQSRDQLQILVERMSTAAAAADMGIWEYDASLGTLDWDRRASGIHRVKSGSQIEGLEDYWASVHEDDRPELQRKFLAMTQGELDSSSQVYRLHPSLEPDGLPVYLKLQALADRSNEQLRILGAVTDVSSELRMAQENEVLQTRIYQLQKMQAVGRFAGSIAHDFNNLLTPIIGHTELIKTQLEPGSVLSRNVDEIYQAADRSRELIQQLLAFDGDPTLEKKPVDMSVVISESEAILKSLVGTNVSLEFDLLQRAMVVANRGQLEQALVNLAANARDAIRNTGTLHISTARVEVDADSSDSYATSTSTATAGSYIELKVNDDGVGMDEATLTQVFEPYFTTKELGRGTGLGMYTIYNFVQQHGGYVWLVSDVSVGTTVSILLPVYTGESAA